MVSGSVQNKQNAKGLAGLAVASATMYGASSVLFSGSSDGDAFVVGNGGLSAAPVLAKQKAISRSPPSAMAPESRVEPSVSTYPNMTTFCASLAAGAAAATVLGSRRQRRGACRRSAAVCRAVASNSVSSKTSSANLPEGVYCEASNMAIRRKTRTVTVGDVKIGSEHRIAIQTMGTTLTHDVEATVAQVKRCADMGIDLVRITVPGMREAKACEHIKKRLLEDGYTTPLVADIHFTPKVALACADFVDKVRINPGNFADGRKSFDTISELTEEHVKESQQAIEEALAPLVLKLKEKGKALRIGVNHGSLSERILFQYGDSPEGMVASAIEVGEICRKYDYHNFLFSMKSSNPQVMVTAYRMLSKEMYKLGWDYPLHLGVTEAGGGADGRIKSAVGIGALLLDGLGDTMRVSLTEDPEYEIAPCAALRQAAENVLGKGVEAFQEDSARKEGRFSRRTCDFPVDVPLNIDGSVLATITSSELATLDTPSLCARFGLRLRKDGDVQREFKSYDAVVVRGAIDAQTAKNVQALLNVPLGVVCEAGPFVPEGATVMYNADEVTADLPSRVGGYALQFTGNETQETIERAITYSKPGFLVLRPDSQDGVTYLARRFMARVAASSGRAIPVLFNFRYSSEGGKTEDDVVVQSSSEFGSLFVDGFGEGIIWEADCLDSEQLRESSFNLLQAARMRITKTEFISCPSCGRTLFNLQDTTKNIQERTGHLPGVRIAVMGCIVNGPGEMADADFGYVGSGPGKIDLYVKYNCVKRGIPSEEAVEGLVNLIKEHGRWQDPVTDEEVDVEASVAA